MPLHVNQILNKMGLKEWVSRQLSKAEGKPLLRLFLLGAKGQLEQKLPKPYGFYPRIISAFLSLCFAKWLTDLYRMQMDVKGYSWLVPEYVYKVREQSYQYWQLARLSNKLPTTFTYYKWGDNLMFQIDRQGNQIPYHTHAGIENPSTFDSFLHEYNFPASPERHAHIMVYLKHIKNPYDIQNYLRAKSINMGDWLRAAYYCIYRQLGLTNRWRYDEFVAKPSTYYNWQRLRYAHIMTKDRPQLYNNLDQLELNQQDLLTFIFWFL